MQASLIEVPSDAAGWERFSYDNRTSHDLIRQAIQAKGGPALKDYVLEPILENDWNSWLLRHALTHEEMTGALGSLSTDLSVLDPKDPEALSNWIGVHWLEHQAVEQALGIAS
jgi:hypothetical protein